RSGPTLPPIPRTAWHLTQPFAAKTRSPARGSWVGPKSGWASARLGTNRTAERTSPERLTAFAILSMLRSGWQSPRGSLPLVARLILRIVQRRFLGVDDPVGRRGLVARERPLRPLLVVADVVRVPAAGLRIALAARLRRLVLVVAGGVQVLVVELADRARADA